ncbi:uncharacterized protein LOC133327168 [Musca vetustissima]|uniref:uncharacterized protein LOC133327168 n=1 Tax=Musca vetustissima TaxID=27455 RepID=UPI002AB61AD1|nr:uncharacterized protein LOC133327168 [Musca vetustissima]
MVTPTNSNLSSSAPTFRPRNLNVNSHLPSSTVIDPSTSAVTAIRQTFHATQNKAVLLGTAMVNIVHHGACFPARALIDPASESSFISERLQKKLKLPVKPTISTIRGLPNFKHARMVADYIGSDHTEVVFTVEECLDGVRDLIYHLESYDIATVRCSLPMFYLARYVKSTGMKMILSGEGADEIFGGYLYFFKAPTYHEFHKEMVTRLDQLHVSDILRANKVTMSKGLELRVPFLDTSFVDYVMSTRPEDKIPGPLNCYSDIQSHRMEKYILRKAFESDYLPPAVLWRQKEQFSDGVGYDLIKALPKFAAKRVTDSEFRNASQRFPINPPKTKEAYYYRCIFDEMFPGDSPALSVEKWAPRLDWGCPEDPSGRAQEAHEKRLKEYC